MSDIYLKGFQPYTSCPFITHDAVKFQFNSEYATPVFEQEIISGVNCVYRNIFFSSEDIPVISSIFSLLKEERTVREILQVFDGDMEETIVAVLQTLYEHGIIRIKSREDIPAMAFYRHALSVSRAHRIKMLKQDPVISHENMTTIERHQLLCFLIEACHFSWSSASHISLAISQARSRKIQNVLSSYLGSEYWHGDMLAKGLQKAGISREALERNNPSFPIMGIINFLRHLARTDLESYGICLSLSESNTGSGDLLLYKQEIWDYIKTLELVPDETLDVFYEHDLIDYREGHEDIPAVIFETDEKISPYRQTEILDNSITYIDMLGDAYKQLKHMSADHGCLVRYGLTE